MGSQVSIASLSLAIMLSYFAGSVLGVMGGVGVTELFLMKTYALIGVEETTAAAAALLHRFLFYVFILVVGGLSTWWNRHLFQDREHTKK